MNKIKIISFVSLVSLSLLASGSALATCSDAILQGKTLAGETSADLLGQVTNNGGDSNLQSWFKYGQNYSSLSSATGYQIPSSDGTFCSTVYSLSPCQTYYYQAWASNSAGQSSGDILSFNTRCLPVTVDMKANGSDGPITLNGASQVTLSWSSVNAATCQASGDSLWSGSKSISGSVTLQLNTMKTYTFTLTCTNTSTSQSGSDSVSVIVRPVPPTVVTKPAIVTL